MASGKQRGLQIFILTAISDPSSRLSYGVCEGVQKSNRPCENSGTFRSPPEFRGLRSRRAEKITINRSPRDGTEPRIEFSHGLQNICTSDFRPKIAGV